VDALRQTNSVWIVSATDNSTVLAHGTVQTNEVTMIHRQRRSPITGREQQDVWIRRFQVCQASLQGCPDIVTKATQLSDDAE
jgi:hypothetical protein